MVTEVAMNEEVLRIQKMVAEGKITPEESVELIESVCQKSPEPPRPPKEKSKEQDVPKTPPSNKGGIRISDQGIEIDGIQISDSGISGISGMPGKDNLTRSLTLAENIFSAGKALCGLVAGTAIALGGSFVVLQYGHNSGVSGWGAGVLAIAAIVGGVSVAKTAVSRKKWIS